MVILGLQLFKHTHAIFNSSFVILLYILKSFSKVMIMSLIDYTIFYKNTLAFGELRYSYETNSYKRACNQKVDYTDRPPVITKDFLSFVRSILVKSKLELLLPTLTEICEVLRCHNFLDQIKENSEIFHHCFAQVRCFHGLTIFS